MTECKILNAKCKMQNAGRSNEPFPCSAFCILHFAFSILHSTPANQKSPFRLRALALATLLVAAATCRADEQDATYLEALRVRGLYGLAESVCLRRLSSESLRPDDAAEMSIELSRTYAARARSIAQRADRTAYWQLARDVVRAVVVKQPQHSQRLLLVVQEVFVSCDQCEAARLQLELSPFDRDCRTEYEELLPRSLQELAGVEAAIVEMQSAAARPAAATISVARLRGLLKAVQLQLGETWPERSLPCSRPRTS